MMDTRTESHILLSLIKTQLYVSLIKEVHKTLERHKWIKKKTEPTLGWAISARGAAKSVATLQKFHSLLEVIKLFFALITCDG